MSLSAPELNPPCMELRDARASSVIVQQVPAGCTDAFVEWERNISRAAAAFPGYRGTDLYPPAEGGPADWVVIVHFDDAEQLGRWIDSPERAEWVAKLPGEFRGFRVKTLHTGFGAWFAGQFDQPTAQPPDWKMVLTVLLGLYPTVMLLAILVGPWLSPLGMSGAMLISNALSVSFLQWIGMPMLQRLLAPWLTADAATSRTRSAAWLVLILIVLLGQVALFRLIKG
jgi:antibiotic biosynthesis monooxygenase (ABM) superfamily enzyme